MASFTTQFKNLADGLNLNVNDLQLVTFLPSFHEIVRQVYQYRDNGVLRYIYIETEDSGRDGVDDYFKWFHITEDKKNELIAHKFLNHLG